MTRIIEAVEGTGFKHEVRGLGQSVDTLKSDVRNVAHGAADVARSGVAELRHGAQNAVDSLNDVIGRNPVASIGIAAGVGLLIGMIVHRCRS